MNPEILRISRILFLSLTALLYFLNPNLCAAERASIKKLKDLHLTTSLVEKGNAQAIIVMPAGDRYRAQAEHVRAQVRRLTGVDLPVQSDDVKPNEMLRKHHVIALGNMATNTFIETLYRQWQVILDLKYPGESGYVLRSLHNPYGSGHNVIFLGGSDDSGVNEAARIFAGGLKGDAAALNVGWLMKIKLGKGLSPPVIGAYLQKWNVQSWNDSRRKANDGTITGYDPATYFGWSPISIAGALYYMTGQREYLDTFKELAMPYLRKLPQASTASDAFTDPSNPLVKSDHYRAHMVDCIYDLIEESPLFTNEERLFITNKLLEHQYELDPANTFSVPNGDRHALWHMLSIYTGSRYFSYYYPSPVWNKRIDNVRKAFSSFIKNPTWGERDTLEWVSTSIEPIFDFFLLDGFDSIVQSGTAETFMQGLKTLMSGEQIDDFNRYLPLNLLFKAAYLLKDTSYVWMANRLGADFSVFRIGESYWPTYAEKAKPPSDMVGRLTLAPLARTDRELAKAPVPDREAFQLISYRNGLEKTDDYLLLDGFEGLGRHPYQVNTLIRLRMFGGKNILHGYANDLNIWHNGMTDAHVARSAALKHQLAIKDFAYIHTEVPDMPASKWQRRIVYLKDWWTVVVDRVTAKQAGRYDIVSSWQMGSDVKHKGKPSRRIVSANGTGLASADISFEQISSSVVQGKVSRELGADESVSLASLFFNNSSPKAISPLKQGGYLLSSRQPAFVGVGPYRTPAFLVSADFAYIDRDRMLLAGGTELTLKGDVVFHSDRPVTVLWDLKGGSATISASDSARVMLGLSGRAIDKVVKPGDQMIALAAPQEVLSKQIDSILAGLEEETADPEQSEEKASAPLPEWKPKWEIGLNGKIAIVAEDHTPGGKAQGIWVASQTGRTTTISRIGAEGKQLATVQQSGEALSFWPAKGERQARAFGLLVGFKDDTLRAFSREGKALWGVKAAIHPSFVIGDHYEAPWFTDPRPPFNMTGVYSILVGDLWGKGREEIATGRPCTVEFRALDGSLKARVSTRWGNNTALALLHNQGSYGKGPLLIVGKVYTGNPQLSGINPAYKNVSDNLYDQIIPGFANMHAWLQRGTSGLRVADINGDSREEIIYTLSGHWNELRVYDTNGKALWMKFFGPDKGGSTFMTALDVADINRDGFKEIIVGTKSGWIIAFNHKGNLLWQRYLGSGITTMSASDNRHLIAVGCQDGALVLLDAAGRHLASGNMGAAVTSVIFGTDGVIAGSAKGTIRHYGAIN